MALVERIYLDGGLRWCSSHGLRERTAGDSREHLGEATREAAKPEPAPF
jgi:hypothetical protein